MPPPADLSGDVAQRVIQLLDQQVNPTIAGHGGRAELVAVEQGTAYLRLGGGCQGCSMATVTLSQGIETAIIQALPEITSVVDVTDHQSGTNPYFEAAKNSGGQGHGAATKRSPSSSSSPCHRPRPGSALAVIQAGLDVSDEPAEARRAARLLHACELRFWDALADGV